MMPAPSAMCELIAEIGRTLSQRELCTHSTEFETRNELFRHCCTAENMSSLEYAYMLSRSPEVGGRTEPVVPT